MTRRIPFAFSQLAPPILAGLGAVLFLGCSTKAIGDTDTDEINPLNPGKSSAGSDGAGIDDHFCKEYSRRPCSEDQTGQTVVFPQGQPLGACRYGEQVCENGRWQPCQGLIAPKSKDRCNMVGDDSDCDGAPNQGCECLDTQAPRPCGVSELGICELGVQSCKEGSWGKCEGALFPWPERCDNQGLDEDCDGKTDLEDEDCLCIDGEQEPCALDAKGDCSLGAKTCRQGAWGPCTPRFPQLEREHCAAPRSDDHGNAVGDEDCDGEVDNNARNGKNPLGCRMYMIDEDKDGWGATGLDYALGLDSYSYGCFCEGQVPDSSMVEDTKSRANRDCGDCVEGGDLVVPDAETGYTEPSDCLLKLDWSGGVYDYNCDGEEEKLQPTLAECTEEKERCHHTKGIWAYSVPECGERARVAEGCTTITPPCEAAVASFGTLVQECR